MADEEYDVDDFLAHYGVKGMKWGDATRNAKAVLERNAELAKQGLDAAGKAVGAAGSAVAGSQAVKNVKAEVNITGRKGEKFAKSFFDQKRPGHVKGREFRSLPDKKGRVTKFIDKHNARVNSDNQKRTEATRARLDKELGKALTPKGYKKVGSHWEGPKDKNFTVQGRRPKSAHQEPKRIVKRSLPDRLVRNIKDANTTHKPRSIERFNKDQFDQNYKMERPSKSGVSKAQSERNMKEALKEQIKRPKSWG